MLVSPHDYISHRIYFYGDYDPSMTAFFKAHVPEGGVCFDLGTERGWFTLLMARLVGPRGRVHAFEAFPTNHDRLERNIVLNGYRWAEAFRIAIGDTVGVAHFVPPSNDIIHHHPSLADCGGVGHLSDSATATSILVPTTTLDAHVEAFPIERLDVLKLDIEGAEHSAIRGAERTLCAFRPKIAIEYNPSALRRTGDRLVALDQHLDSLGYDRFTFDGGTLRRFGRAELDELEARDGVVNVYALPRNPVADRDRALGVPR